MAGGVLKAGIVHGTSDELDFHALENPHYVTDGPTRIHHLRGIDLRCLEVPGYQRLARTTAR